MHAADVRREHNVTVRTYNDSGQTICVVVNECPWHADVTIDVVSTDRDRSHGRWSPAKTVPTTRSISTPAGRSGRSGWRRTTCTRCASPRRTWRSRTFNRKSAKPAGRSSPAEMKELKDRDLTATPRYTPLRNPSFEPGGAERIARLADSGRSDAGRRRSRCQNAAGRPDGPLFAEPRPRQGDDRERDVRHAADRASW